jgi:hypothetical protein
MGLRDRQQGDRQQIVMRLDVAENSVGSIPSAISTISMPDSHVLPSLQAQAASTLDAAIGCQDENDAADRRPLRKEVSPAGIDHVKAEGRSRVTDDYRARQFETNVENLVP